MYIVSSLAWMKEQRIFIGILLIIIGFRTLKTLLSLIRVAKIIAAIRISLYSFQLQ